MDRSREDRALEVLRTSVATNVASALTRNVTLASERGVDAEYAVAVAVDAACQTLLHYAAVKRAASVTNDASMTKAALQFADDALTRSIRAKVTELEQAMAFEPQ